MIDDSNRQQVPLGEELEFALKYLDIQKVRFAERLQVSVSVPSELFSTAVPSLILQPMVENAVKHGIAKRVQGGVIRIRAFPTDDKVTLSVYNDGPMLPQGWEQQPSGIGLANVRTRLQSLYGKQFEVNMHNQEPGGVEVSIFCAAGAAELSTAKISHRSIVDDEPLARSNIPCSRGAIRRSKSWRSAGRARRPWTEIRDRDLICCFSTCRCRNAMASTCWKCWEMTAARN